MFFFSSSSQFYDYAIYDHGISVIESNHKKILFDLCASMEMQSTSNSIPISIWCIAISNCDRWRIVTKWIMDMYSVGLMWAFIPDLYGWINELRSKQKQKHKLC